MFNPLVLSSCLVGWGLLLVASTALTLWATELPEDHWLIDNWPSRVLVAIGISPLILTIFAFIGVTLGYYWAMAIVRFHTDAEWQLNREDAHETLVDVRDWFLVEIPGWVKNGGEL